MKKHAYLVVAHDKKHQLEQLLSLLDHRRNDVYLMVDSAASIGTEGLSLTKGTLYIVPRMRINWAGYSMIRAIIAMLKIAVEKQYHYYHLLSGVDLPLVSQEEIHAFLEDSDAEYVDFAPENRQFARFKTAYYHIFVDMKAYRKYLPLRLAGHALIKFQKVLGIDRIRKFKEAPYHGSAWFSITHRFAMHLVDQAHFIHQAYRMTLSADEVYIQTVLMDSAFKDKLYDCSTGKTRNLRYIDWKRRDKNSPYTFRFSDIDELSRAAGVAFFARKFNEDVDADVTEAIVSRLRSGSHV